MPWGWECRAKLIKQFPSKPTERRGKIGGEISCPGPQHYETPPIFCGKGYSKIERAPAYTFGHVTPVSFQKPLLTPKAPVLDTSGASPKGPYKIHHGVVSPRLEPPGDKTKTPGPGTHAPKSEIRYRRPPAYTMRPAAKPPYQPWDQWTPPPNMYLPAKPTKKPPAYTLGYAARELSVQYMPGPGEHDPNFNFVKQSKPAYSFGAPYKSPKPKKEPSPNAYCEKKFMYPKRTIPAPSFGIRHTPYLGKQAEYLKPSQLNIVISGES
ncbi:extensin-like [Colias croceus]|uniref:extensin-like n=1 Tax=Colias crocea TaxID=72248 RepID=UPI001E27FCD9|nr:extensin-like [Colias croceus]